MISRPGQPMPGMNVQLGMTVHKLGGTCAEINASRPLRFDVVLRQRDVFRRRILDARRGEAAQKKFISSKKELEPFGNTFESNFTQASASAVGLGLWVGSGLCVNQPRRVEGRGGREMNK